MRRSLFLYLFVFSALTALFIYVNAQRMLRDKNEDIEELREELELQSEKIDSLSTGSSDFQYFSLIGNDDAISYFENKGFDASEIATRIKDEIRSRNLASKDNDLVPYVGMTGKMRINKIKILNHKWVIADFTDGSYWGEILLSYSIDENGNLVFDNIDSFLYPKN